VMVAPAAPQAPRALKTMKQIAVLLVLFSLSLPAQPAAIDSADIAATILSIMDEQVRGWNNGSIDAFMKGYAQANSLRFASGGTVTYGWKTMLERYKKSYSTKERMGILQFSDISVTIISGDAALAFGTWTLQREQDKPRGLFTLLFRKNNGTWHIVHDHTSSGN